MAKTKAKIWYADISEKFHQGGLMETVEKDGWKLEICKYGTETADRRDFLKRGRPYYAVLTTKSPGGILVAATLEGFQSLDAVKLAAFGSI